MSDAPANAASSPSGKPNACSPEMKARYRRRRMMGIGMMLLLLGVLLAILAANFCGKGRYQMHVAADGTVLLLDSVSGEVTQADIKK